MNDPQALAMEAFDREGFHVGHARFIIVGALQPVSWYVYIDKIQKTVWCVSQKDAEDILRYFGAEVVLENDGTK